HSYACYISPTAKYVTPVPSDDLDLLSTFTLAAPLDEKATEIVVKESTANVSTVIGYTETSNKTLKIGKEIIQFTDVTREAPFKFTGCKRGWHKTAVSAHAAGDSIGILKTYWSGLYVPRPDSALWEEVAKNHADVVNECGFDGIYFDAIEGIRDMWGQENYWYYGSKFVFDVVKHLKKPVGFEYAGMMHHWWHYRSRYQAWDKPRRGYKRFMDIHIAAMKAGQEYQHGCWEGHLPEIEKYAPMKDCGLFLPLQLGWSDMHAWTDPKTEPTYYDDIEYVCCKMIGNNAGLSMTSGLDKARLRNNPEFLRYARMIAQYEELRHSNYFDESIRAELRKPGKDFTLFKANDGKWKFKPMVYDKHKVCGLSHPSGMWNVENVYDTQPIKLRLEVLMSCAAYDDPDAVVMTDYAKADDLSESKTVDGVAIKMTPAEKIPGVGDQTVCLSGTNKTAARDASWAFVGKSLTTPLNLSTKQAFGVWVKGDGKGEVVDLRVESHPIHYGKSDHFIKVDFTGWKYFELIESESTAISEYVWPKTKGYFVYSNYRGAAKYSEIDTFQIWLNNIPTGEKTESLIGPVKALPTMPIEIENPTFVVNRQKMILPVTMKTGMYFELLADGFCQVYDASGKPVQRVKPIGGVPELKKGNNNVTFTCDAKHTTSTRVQVTVITEGKPLQ
ncbi:MAG: hypothetical protein Q4G59_07415, partial [Planctomycetia bacterium]|nr:hypothetical protein [Planctomycetia bacterium]